MKIAYSQVNSIVGAISQNKDIIISQVTRAIEQGADLVVFNEFAISGSPTYDLVYTKDYSERCYMALSDIATYSDKIAILIGTPSSIDGEHFSSAVLLEKGEISAHFNKAMVTSRDESAYYVGIDSELFSDNDVDADSVGENIIEVAGKRILVALGEDIDFVQYLECFTAVKKPHLIINMTAVPFHHGVTAECDKRYGAIAKGCVTPLLVVNSAGANTDVIFSGDSTLYSAEGRVVDTLAPFVQDMGAVELAPKLKGGKREYFSHEEHCYKAIEVALADYCRKSNIKSVCLGLSGGIDSAVVTAIAVDVLGKENVRVALMPSQFSSDHSIADAEALAQKLGIHYETLPIEPIYNSFMAGLENTFKGTEFSLAEENLQARIRGVLVMAISNKFGCMLLNTSNKSEAAMGYGTLYGDTNGGLSILGDLYKWEVYALARYINRNEEIIPQNTIDKAPSAELRPGQKDSDSLPEYDVLDKILYRLLEGAESASDLLASGVNGELLTQITKRLRDNEYKRYQLPPVVRLSKCTLGKGRVMPIVGKY